MYLYNNSAYQDISFVVVYCTVQTLLLEIIYPTQVLYADIQTEIEMKKLLKALLFIEIVIPSFISWLNNIYWIKNRVTIYVVSIQ